MEKIREMGEMVYEIREVTGSSNDKGFRIWNFITG